MAALLLSTFFGDENGFGVLQFVRDPSQFADSVAIRSTDPMLRDLQQTLEAAFADHADLFE